MGIPVSPLVSVVTVVFNGERTIERAIKSVLQQTYPNIEYIVIDGGSTDNTVSIITKYANRIAHWQSEPDGGIADAFNKGIERANGEIIAFLNADDWYNPDAVERVVPFFDRHSVVYGDVQFWKGSLKRHKTKASHLKLHQGMTLAHPAVFVRRAMHGKYGLFNPQFKIGMDYEFIAKLYFNKEPFCKVDAVLANMSLGGLSDRKWLSAFSEEKKVKARYLGRVLSNYAFFKQIVLFSLQRLRLWLIRIFGNKSET